MPQIFFSEESPYSEGESEANFVESRQKNLPDTPPLDFREVKL